MGVSQVGNRYHVMPLNPPAYAVTPSPSHGGNFAAPTNTLPANAVWIGQYLATEEAIDISVPDGMYNRIRFELVSGTVELKNVWLKPGDTKVPIAARIQPGLGITLDFKDIPRKINALRVEDEGRGVFRIYGLPPTVNR